MRKMGWILSAMAISGWGLGCAGSETRMSDVELKHDFPDADGEERLTIGVIDVEDKTDSEGALGLNRSAADQLTTLAVKSGRFKVIERGRLNDILEEQSLSASRIFEEPSAIAGKLKGVDYLLLGSITGLRVKGTRSGNHFGFFGAMWYYTYRWLYPTLGFSLPPIDYKSRESEVSVECEVDLRVVHVESAEVIAAGQGAFMVTDSLKAIDIEVGGYRNDDPEAELELDDKNKGKVVRFALHKALLDMLSQVDDRRELVAKMARKRELAEATP